jgi:hypothetical protein
MITIICISGTLECSSGFRIGNWIPYWKTFTKLHGNSTDAKAVCSTEERLNSSKGLSNELNTGGRVNEKENDTRIVNSIEFEQDKEEDKIAVQDKESEGGK